MISNFLSRVPLHQHAEASQRLLGVEKLAGDSEELAQLLAADPAPEVRIAAARHCSSVSALLAACAAEADTDAKRAIESALGQALAELPESETAQATLQAEECSDAVRVDVARRASVAQRRRTAIGSIRDEGLLVELALEAEHAETRMAAAERVCTPRGLRHLAGVAKDKDRGIAKLARQRMAEIDQAQWQQQEADAIIGRLEALACDPGPILTGVVEADRRWQALEGSADPERIERFRAARGTVQARFDREQEAQRSRLQFGRRLREWLHELDAAIRPEAVDGDATPAGMRTELSKLREEARQHDDDAALARLDGAERRIANWEERLQAAASAQALVVEAEQLSADTSADSGLMLQRWQSLDPAVRTPALTRRFEAAMTAIEKRRLDLAQAHKQEAAQRRHQLHGLLHEAEQALAAGQLQAVRTKVDALKPLRAGANLSKPTAQRVSRLLQQLGELERWESFGQREARVRLCERAQAIASQELDVAQRAKEVQALRREWKALDEQHAGVPKALWERFDAACEKAYAPAARHFAELAARNKEARRQRDEFIGGATERVQALLEEPRNWREIEHWLRDAGKTWREGDLGSVNPNAWKALDTRFRAACAPLREALSGARDQARAARQQLIEEILALEPCALERDTLTKVKSVQARWQEHAKTLPLRRRDESALWERFRAACDKVFDARKAKHKQDDAQRQDLTRAQEAICAQLEQLAKGTDAAGAELDAAAIRAALREQKMQWNTIAGNARPAMRDFSSHYNKAIAAVEALLAERARGAGAAAWKTLAAKERLCDALDRLVRNPGADDGEAVASLQQQWDALPAMQQAWEVALVARRDAALHAVADASARRVQAQRIEAGMETRRGILVEVELSLGMESPAAYQAQRLALQVKLLKERFRGSEAGRGGTPGERLLAWCALPGVCDGDDSDRVERIFAQIEKTQPAR